jgi:protein-L-isoaspartate(D-aspartate) O-methyltransferase
MGSNRLFTDLGPEDLVEAARLTGVRDERVLGAMRAVPRDAFVAPDVADRAYRDEPLPIPHRQVTTQPSLVARMLEALDLEAEDTALEIGTGYGYQTALLAELAASVWSVERWPDLAEVARENLARRGTENVRVVVGDGSAGLAEHAPFDAIVVSAAFPQVPQPLAEQLTDGGRLVQPIGRGGADTVMLFERRKGELVRRGAVTAAHFVRLYGRHGFEDG